MEILSQQWWFLGLTCVSILFTSLLGLYLYSKRIEKNVKTPYTYVVDIPMADGTVAMTSMMGEVESTDLYTPRYKLVDKLMSRTFVAIPILGALLYLISHLPGFTSPSWFNIVLQFITYGSAAILYLFVKNDDT